MLSFGMSKKLSRELLPVKNLTHCNSWFKVDLLAAYSIFILFLDNGKVYFSNLIKCLNTFFFNKTVLSIYFKYTVKLMYYGNNGIKLNGTKPNYHYHPINWIIPTILSIMKWNDKGMV